MRRLLEPGTTCWRLEQASRAAVLVDGSAYFAAFRAAARRARRSLVILGWDIDSRVRLTRDGPGDDLPATLGDFLNALAERSSGLDVFLLDWDFSMLYAAAREPFPFYQLGWRTHPRVRFRLDGAHPVGACHHQKLVVIDNAVAFAGGFDLTHHRWDTPAHAPDDARRRGPEGRPYPPFHDVQFMVEGDVAAALGELARERWRRAAGDELPADRAPHGDLWPEDIVPDLTDVPVGIARTMPKYGSYPAVDEVRRLLKSVIASARHSLYLESQYFTADEIAAALARRLGEPDPPDVALVSRRTESGWLEERTMGVLRARQHRRLRAADRHGRYRSFYPHVPGLAEACVNVHTKLVMADDEAVTIGSANLSNRSLGLDTECVLAVEAASDERVRAAIRDIRHRLLAEHLGTSREQVAAAESRTGRLLAAIDELASEGRSLRVLEPEGSEDLPPWALDGVIVDPERPLEPDAIVADLLPADESGSVTGRLAGVAAAVVGALALAALWRWTALGAWLDIDAMARVGHRLTGLPGAPLLVLAAHVVAGLLVIPVTVLVAATVLVFGAWPGFAYALGGSLLSAAATYGIGRRLGRDTVRSLAGSRLNRLSRRLARRGLAAVVVVRLVPVAPFTVVNLVAGAMRVGPRDFLLGTTIGLLPGLVVVALFVDRVVAQVRNPSLDGLIGLGALTAVVLALAAALHYWQQRRRAVEGSAAAP